MKYLESIGFRKIDYEPDGNIPPDFLVESSIAIEVRRLNKHIETQHPGEFEPLEKLKSSLIPKINAIFKRYSNISFYNSALVTIDFSRPLVASKQLLRQIKISLDEHLPYLKNIDKRKDVKINENLTISLWPIDSKYESPYILGAFLDNDSGGLVVSDVYNNLRLIIKEKENKIKPYFSKYPTWWLVLVDCIGYGLNDYDMDQLNGMKIETHLFEKIILLDPLEPTKYKILKIFN